MAEHKCFVFTFADVKVREREFSIVKAGEVVPVEPKAFRVLLVLLRNPHRLITKDELLDAVWNEVAVSENSLTRSIALLRRLLGDDTREPRYIATVPTVGYRFLCDVDAVDDSAPTPGEDPRTLSASNTAQDSRQSSKRFVFTLVAAVAAIALLLSLSDEKSSIARSPFGTFLRGITLAHHATTQPAVIQRRLTANTDDAPVTAGVISPDGKHLAYSDPTGLHLRQVDGGETVSVPLPQGFDALPESWFPDSLHLVVSHTDNPQTPPSLWQISILGGKPRKLAAEGSSARVSPDGSKIVFLLHSFPGGDGIVAPGVWEHEEFWLLQVNDNSARKIADSGKDYFGPPAWAPDATRFAYLKTSLHPGQNRAETQIEVFDLATNRSEAILTEPRLGAHLAWTSPNRLIFSLWEGPPNPGDSNLWWVPLDSRTAHPFGHPTRITSDRNPAAGISVSSDGKRLAVLRRSFQYDVYVSDVPAHGKRLTTPRRLTQDERQDFATSWTPDSKSVLFISNRDGPFHIFKQNIEEPHPDLLVGGTESAFLPRLTPDGANVIYQLPVSGEADKTRLMRVPLSGGPSQPVLESTGLYNHACARLPSTLCLYGAIESRQQRIFAFDPAGATRDEVLADKLKTKNGPSINWGLSPDGKFLVTVNTQDPYEASALRIFDITSGAERYIPIPGTPHIVSMDWAADSKSVWLGTYIGRDARGARSGLLNVDLNGNAVMALDELNLGIWAAVPSPDGHHLAIGRNTQTSNVSLLENF